MRGKVAGGDARRTAGGIGTEKRKGTRTRDPGGNELEHVTMAALGQRPEERSDFSFGAELTSYLFCNL